MKLEIDKCRENLNTVSTLDLTHIYKTLYPEIEYKFFSSTDKFKNTEFIQSIFSNHKEWSWKSTAKGKLRTHKHVEIKQHTGSKKPQGKFKNHLKVNENENKT